MKLKMREESFRIAKERLLMQQKLQIMKAEKLNKKRYQQK